MPTSYTSLLGLALPVTGELSGTWGDTVNDYITQYLDGAVAGTQTISGSQTAVTLSKTTASALTQVGSGATGSSQYSVINCTGNPASLLTITAPAASKPYIVINATSTSQQVKLVGVGPTTGVTLEAGEKAVVAWNGSDFTKIATSAADGVTSISFGTTGLTPSTTTTGAVTVAGTLATANGGTGLTTFNANGAVYASSASALTTGTLPVASGGTGITAFGTGVGTALGQNVTGSGGIVLATSPTLTTPILGTPQSVTLTNATGLPLSTGVTGTLPAANGGTGLSSPGSSGNVLTSNGTAWTSSPLPAGGLTYVYKTSNYTVANKEGVLADTSGGSFTVTLPATPTTGDQVVVADAGASWGTNNLTVGRNGSTIGGLAEDLVCDITGASVQLVYDGTTWEVYAQVGGNGGNVVTTTGVQTLTNKTIAFGSNTLTDVASTNTSQTLTNKTIAFGSNTLTDVASTNTSQTLTNKTLTSPTLTSPVLGTPASGNLTNCTADGTSAVGYRNIPQSGSAKTTSYTLATSDVGEFINVGSGGSVTIPDATFAAGDVVSIYNDTSGNITITCSITTAYISGTNTDKATMTLATRGVATVLFISGTVCVVSGSVT